VDQLHRPLEASLLTRINFDPSERPSQFVRRAVNLIVLPRIRGEPFEVIPDQPLAHLRDGARFVVGEVIENDFLFGHGRLRLISTKPLTSFA
jgi:hypothetical protein